MASRKRLIDEGAALQALAALAQAQRLRAFRALVTAGPEGMTPGLLAARLDIGASVLSFHLKELAHAGLVSSEARGRNLIYRAKFDHMNALLAYLTEHCCQGLGCEPALARPNCAPC
jgi:ArsR family transcriptional regulator, arsenate/arsenite/antimonite-responsive transcriptional repressor